MQSAIVRWVTLAVALLLYASGPAATAHAQSASAVGVVNVNSGSVEELMLLPGIGRAKAQAIAAYRTANGPFESVEQLREVKGIGDRALERLRKFVVLEGDTTAGTAKKGAPPAPPGG